MPMNAFKVGVITDWRRVARASSWPALFGELKNDGLHVTVTEYPIADLLTADPAIANQPALHNIRDEDVIVINWDAVNGDPDFGAHLALRWLEHRQPEVLIRLRKGSILIMESQAVLGVPCQAAYDAAAGKGELPVSGPCDPQDPMKFIKNTGAKCRKTRHFPKSGAFEDVPDHLGVRGTPNSKDMFPGTASNILVNELKGLNWQDILYRGWFRRLLFRSRRLKWVSIIGTANRGRFRNHSVMQVAKVSRGAIFATTMMLATTGQKELVRAIVECAGGNTSHLPIPAPKLEKLRAYWKRAVSLAGGAIVGYFFSDELLAAAGLGALEQDLAKGVLVLLFGAIGGGLFEILHHLIRWSRKWWRDFVGY
jgi:hypothetical protein